MPNTLLAIGDNTFGNDMCLALSGLSMDMINETDLNLVRDISKRPEVVAVLFDWDAFRSKNKDLHHAMLNTLRDSKKDFIAVSRSISTEAVSEARNFGASDYIMKPYNHREFIARLNAVIRKKTRICCIGGGTGLFHVLLGLKEVADVLLTSVVNMSDDGGSSGRLRASFGILPPGDVRRSLVALSNAPEVMNQLMAYRFEKGEGISGHNLGNLFLTALSEIKGSLSEAVRAISDILNIQGIVLPVTNTQTTLCVRFEDGAVLEGESKIDLGEGRKPDLHISQAWHEPETGCNVDAFSSLLFSDIVIIGPGDLFTSVITNLLVRNITEAISKTKAKKIYICNLMTKPGETAHYNAYDHVDEIIKYTGGDYLDYIIVSNTKLSDKAIREYAKKGQSPVVAKELDKINAISRAEVVTADVGHEEELVRHDSGKIRNEIMRILNRECSPKTVRAARRY